jgi:hypothetical protein
MKVGQQVANAIYTPRYLQASDFLMASGQAFASVSVLPSQWTTIGAYQVGYRNFYAFGVGAVTDNGRDDRRTATIKVYGANGTQFTSGAIDGAQLMLALTDSNLYKITPVQIDLCSNWSAGVKLGEDYRIATFQSYLVLRLNPAVAETVTASASTQADVPVSNYAQ